MLIHVQPVIMILRVYALYGRSTSVIVFLVSILVVQLSISAVGLHTGFGIVKSHQVNFSCNVIQSFSLQLCRYPRAFLVFPGHYLACKSLISSIFIGCILTGTNPLFGELLVCAMHYQ